MFEYTTSLLGFAAGWYAAGKPLTLVVGPLVFEVDQETFLSGLRADGISPGRFEDGVWIVDPRDHISGFGFMLDRHDPSALEAAEERLAARQFTVKRSYVWTDQLRPLGALFDRLVMMSTEPRFHRIKKRCGWDVVLRWPEKSYREGMLFTL